MTQKMRAFRYHNDKPEGQLFNETKVFFDELEQKGWVNTPAKLDVKIEKEPTITAEQIESMSSDELVGMVKSMGFNVLSDEMLTAEINKALSVPIDVTSIGTDLLKNELISRLGEDEYVALNLELVNNETLIAEAERRGLKNPDLDEPLTDDSEGEPSPLLNRFYANPTDLNKEELVVLGSEYKLGLRMSFSEQTMIDKITEALSKAE